MIFSEQFVFYFKVNLAASATRSGLAQVITSILGQERLLKDEAIRTGSEQESLRLSPTIGLDYTLLLELEIQSLRLSHPPGPFWRSRLHALASVDLINMHSLVHPIVSPFGDKNDRPNLHRNAKITFLLCL